MNVQFAEQHTCCGQQDPLWTTCQGPARAAAMLPADQYTCGTGDEIDDGGGSHGAPRAEAMELTPPLIIGYDRRDVCEAHSAPVPHAPAPVRRTRHRSTPMYCVCDKQKDSIGATSTHLPA